MAAPASAAPIAASGDLVGRHRQIGRHRRRVDRAGDGAGDDDFVLDAMAISSVLVQRPMSLSARRLCAASAISRRSRHACRSTSLSAGRRLRRSASTFVHDRPGPIDAPLRGGKDAGVDLLITLGVVAHAARRIEVDGLERPHEATSATPARRGCRCRRPRRWRSRRRPAGTPLPAARPAAGS